MKVGPGVNRLKASFVSPKRALRSKELETRAQILTYSIVYVASGNINYAAVVVGASHETSAAKRGAASTDPRVSAGMSQSDNAARNLRK